MDDRDYTPVLITVIWNGERPELKLLTAIDALIKRAADEGMSPAAARRVGAYVKAMVDDTDESSSPSVR